MQPAERRPVDVNEILNSPGRGLKFIEGRSKVLTSELLQKNMVIMSSTFAFSDFLRRPNEVVAALDSGDVVLQRRGAPNLRLVVDDRADRTLESVRMLAKVFRSAMHDDVVATALVVALTEELAWLDLMPEHERTRCVRELLRSAEAGADAGELAPFAQTVHEWKQTAAVYANPALVVEAVRPLSGEPVTIPRPTS